MKEIKYNASKRTEERIKKAFLVLLSEKKDLNKITVSEIAEKSGVTRGTFYAYFKNIFEVAEAIEDDFISDLEPIIEELSGVEDFPIYLHKIFEFLNKNEDLYHQILSNSTPFSFINKLNSCMKRAIKKIMQEQEHERPILELDIAFFSDGATYMILKYFRGEIDLSLDEIEWYLKQKLLGMILK